MGIDRRYRQTKDERDASHVKIGGEVAPEAAISADPSSSFFLLTATASQMAHALAVVTVSA